MLPLKVLVADDHKLFRQGLISLMRTRRDLLEVVGEAASGQEAVEMVDLLHPDLVLMDLYMPELNGLQAAEVIRQRTPETAIVMLTSSEHDNHLYDALRLGVSGYLLKTLDAKELFDLILSVAQGETVLTRTMASRILRRISRSHSPEISPEEGLTVRELEVLDQLAKGESNAEIAENLFISVNTVKVHIRNILQKLNVENRTQAATEAIRTGLVPQD
jgi:DNA-binding NarL/FixJ family response regulator